MARRKKSKVAGKLLLVGALGAGAYLLWKTGLPQQWWASLQQPAGGQMGGEDGEIPQTAPVDENANKALASLTDTALAALGLVQTWISDQDERNNEAHEIDHPEPDSGEEAPVAPQPPSPGGEKKPWSVTLPDWLAGVPAGGATLTGSEVAAGLAKAAFPIWLGTSKTAAELVHKINVAIPGKNTGLEKGNKTLFTRSGPFIVNPNTHTCYNLARKRIPCPAPEEVIGISRETLQWYEKEVAAE